MKKTKRLKSVSRHKKIFILCHKIVNERSKIACLWGNIQRSFQELFSFNTRGEEEVRRKKVSLLFRLVSLCSLNRKTLYIFARCESFCLPLLVIISIFHSLDAPRSLGGGIFRFSSLVPSSSPFMLKRWLLKLRPRAKKRTKKITKSFLNAATFDEFFLFLLRSA